MSIDQESQMSDAEIDDFLGSHETGVLSLARDNDPYSIPISYGYDATARTFYMRLVSTPESEKRAFLASEPSARLVVYDGTETAYQSVVATGHLEEVPPDELTVEHIEQYGEAKRPLFEIWADSKANLDIELYEFEPETLSGRQTVLDLEGEDESTSEGESGGDEEE